MHGRYIINVRAKSEVISLTPKTGRPPISNPKNIRLEIRMTRDEADLLQQCADELKISRTDVINKGIRLVRSELDNKK